MYIHVHMISNHSLLVGGNFEMMHIPSKYQQVPETLVWDRAFPD